MNRAQRLAGIRAKCVELLKIAEQRTPGKWDHYSDRVCSNSEFHDEAQVDNVDVCQGITWRKDSPKQKIGENLIFIASCAVNAESGWRSTVAAIDHISELLRHPLPELTAAAEALADVILNEWEGVV